MSRSSTFDSCAIDPYIFNRRYFCTTPTTTDMAGLLGELGEVVTEALSWTVEAVNTIVGNPFLLMTTGFLVLGGAIGILGRLLSRN